MKTIEVEKNKYEILKDYKNGFDLDDFISHYTDFYEDYDYIVGDIAYNKLRLKGFYESNNKKVKVPGGIKILNIIIPLYLFINHYLSKFTICLFYPAHKFIVLPSVFYASCVV